MMAILNTDFASCITCNLIKVLFLWLLLLCSGHICIFFNSTVKVYIFSPNTMRIVLELIHQTYGKMNRNSFQTSMYILMNDFDFDLLEQLMGFFDTHNFQ